MERVIKMANPFSFETLCFGLRSDIGKGFANEYMFNIMLLKYLIWAA